jgi:uncharacterized protein
VSPRSGGRRPSPDSPAAPGPDDLESAVTPCPGGAAVAVRVIPRAGASRVAGTRQGAVLVRLAAAPVDGAANAALVSFLADALHVTPGRIAIAAGHRSRDKRVIVAGGDAAAIRRTLRASGR